MQVGELYNPKGVFAGVWIPDSLVRCPDLSLGAKVAFGRLCWHIGENGQVFPSQPTLAEEIGVSLRSVEEYLRELELFGLIKKQRAGRITYYHFPWHSLLEESLKIKQPHPGVDLENKAKKNSSTSAVRPAESRENESRINNVLSEVSDKETTNSVFSEKEREENTLDTSIELVQTLWREIFGVTLLLSTKDQDWVEQVLIPKFPVLDGLRDKILEYSQEPGKGTFKGLQEFLGLYQSKFKTNRPSGDTNVIQRPSKAYGSQYTKKPSSTRRSSSPPPLKAFEWNDKLPHLEWKIWSEQFASLWNDELEQDWDKVLEICVKISPRVENFSFLKMLKEWGGILNGNYNWALSNGKASVGGSLVDQMREKAKTGGLSGNQQR